MGLSPSFESILDFRLRFHFQIIHPIFFILLYSSFLCFYPPQHFILPFGNPQSFFKFVQVDFWNYLILFILLIFFTIHFQYPFLIMHYSEVGIQPNEETIKVTYDTFLSKGGTIDHRGILNIISMLSPKSSNQSFRFCYILGNFSILAQCQSKTLLHFYICLGIFYSILILNPLGF